MRGSDVDEIAIFQPTHFGPETQAARKTGKEEQDTVHG
jgi:hypothetical protein